MANKYSQLCLVSAFVCAACQGGSVGNVDYIMKSEGGRDVAELLGDVKLLQAVAGVNDIAINRLGRERAELLTGRIAAIVSVVQVKLDPDVLVVLAERLGSEADVVIALEAMGYAFAFAPQQPIGVVDPANRMMQILDAHATKKGGRLVSAVKWLRHRYIAGASMGAVMSEEEMILRLDAMASSPTHLEGLLRSARRRQLRLVGVDEKLVRKYKEGMGRRQRRNDRDRAFGGEQLPHGLQFELASYLHRHKVALDPDVEAAVTCDLEILDVVRSGLRCGEWRGGNTSSGSPEQLANGYEESKDVRVFRTVEAMWVGGEWDTVDILLLSEASVGGK